MEYIIYLSLIIITVVLLKIVFKIKYKELKKLSENKELEKITDKFPENVEVTKEILEMLNNKDVKIEEAKDTRNKSLYCCNKQNINC